MGDIRHIFRRRDNQNRHAVAARTNMLDKLNAVHTRHFEIADHQIHIVLLQIANAINAVAGFKRTGAERQQEVVYQRTENDLIFDNEYLFAD